MLLYLCFVRFQLVRFFARSDDYITVSTTLSRLLAAKPHSADVERLISASNMLKSPHRCRMTVATENLYQFVHYNMPPLYEWDPTPAVVHWLDKCQHRERDRMKARKQPYFRGIFPDASTTQCESSESDNELARSETKPTLNSKKL